MVVKLLGIVIVAASVIFMAKPETLKNYANFWAKEKRIYAGGVISIALGILLLRAAPACAISWVVVVVAIWAIIKGVVLFYLGPEKLKKQMNAILKMPAKNQRLLMLISLAIGILLISSA